MNSVLFLGAISFVVVGGLVYYYMNKSESEDQVFDKSNLLTDNVEQTEVNIFIYSIYSRKKLREKTKKRKTKLMKTKLLKAILKL